MKVDEIHTNTNKPLTADQRRLQALKDQAKKSRDAIKAERARQKIKAANQALSAALTSSRLPEESRSPLRLVEAHHLRTYQAQVRAKNGGGSMMCFTNIEAESIAHANAMLNSIFGKGNVLSVVEVLD